jgi:hypothetical protein
VRRALLNQVDRYLRANAEAMIDLTAAHAKSACSATGGTLLRTARETVAAAERVRELNPEEFDELRGGALLARCVADLGIAVHEQTSLQERHDRALAQAVEQARVAASGSLDRNGSAVAAPA